MRASIAATLALLLAAFGSDGADGGNGAGQSAGAGGPTLQAGQWETTIRVLAIEMPGTPPETAEGALQQQPSTARICLTEAQVAAPLAEFVRGAAEQGCDASDMAMSGGRIRGTIQCTSGEEGATIMMEIVMDGQFTPTSYEVTQNMEVSAGDGPAMTMRARTTGRRIGDCPSG